MLLYTVLGSLVVILIGVTLGFLARKKKKFITVKPTGTVSKLYKTAGGIEPTFESYWSTKSSFKDKFVPIPVEPVPSSASTFVQELKEQYASKCKKDNFIPIPPFREHKIVDYTTYKCPLCEHEKEKYASKEKPLSAIEEIKKEEDARVFKEINKAINRGIHIRTAYGHRMEMTDLPEFPTCTTDVNGNKYWRNEKGETHREDGPAVEYSNGGKSWFLNNTWYTEEEWKKELNKPTCTTDPCGNKIWRNKKGQFHREDGPAVEYPNGGKSWFLNNTWYTEEDWKKKLVSSKYPKCTTDVNGNKYWRNEKGETHREDGPAVEHAEGYKSWYLNGKWHREDGPAIEFADGRKNWCLNGIIYTEEEWKRELDKRNSLECSDKLLPNGNRCWKNKEGKLHREDGPAMIYTNGTKEWWINGRTHREDGPAVEFASGTKWWYLNGVRHTEREWKKELDKSKCTTCNYGIKRWTNKEGLVHREDGPAVEHADGSKFWYINNKLHREDGPAIDWYNGYKEWYLDGKKYKDEEAWKQELVTRRWKITPENEDIWIPIRPKPKTDKNGNIVYKNKDGKWHREDGPAVIYTNGTKAWWLNGKQHRDDGPAVEFADGRKHCWYLNSKQYLTEEDWKKELNKPKCTTDNSGTKYWKNKEGKLHREDGPAFEYYDGTKHWYINGKLHREDGPAVVYASGSKSWWLNGVAYTEEDWKRKLNKPKIDINGGKRWYNKEGQQHREDGPAFEYYDGTKHWYINGKLHREDGPALERANGTKEWYLNGKYYTEENWKKELNKPKCTTDGHGTKIWYNKKNQAHREDGPAYEYATGSKFWYINGVRHREDGPAVEYPNGGKCWYLHGKEYYTEEDWEEELNKPTLSESDGHKRWFNNKGQYHREDGPAYESPSGFKQWIVNGKFHREDGPAVENNQGLKQWWLNGNQYHTEEEWKQEVSELARS